MGTNKGNATIVANGKPTDMAAAGEKAKSIVKHLYTTDKVVTLSAVVAIAYMWGAIITGTTATVLPCALVAAAGLSCALLLDPKSSKGGSK